MTLPAMRTIDDAIEFIRARARDLRANAAKEASVSHPLSEGGRIAAKKAEELGRIANEIERKAKRSREDGLVVADAKQKDR